MKKNILAVIIFILLLLLLFIPMITAEGKENNGTTISEVDIPSGNIIIEVVNPSVKLQGNFLYYTKPTDPKRQLPVLIEKCQERKKAADELAAAAKACGYPSDHPIIKLAYEEWVCANKALKLYEKQYEEVLYGAKYDEYPTATEVWVFLKKLGYNDFVCAGILGNMMAEVGGGTLDLQWYLGEDYYGLCQWNKYWYPEVYQADVSTQLKYLRDNIEDEFNYAGRKYKENFYYEDFLEIKDEREAALSFAMCYERCNSKYYEIRANYAEVAYDYFVN